MARTEQVHRRDLLSLRPSLSLTVSYGGLVSRARHLPWGALAVGVALFALVLEGLRRAVGSTLVPIVLAIVGYGRHRSSRTRGAPDPRGRSSAARG